MRKYIKKVYQEGISRRYTRKAQVSETLLFFQYADGFQLADLSAADKTCDQCAGDDDDQSDQEPDRICGQVRLLDAEH